MVQHSSSRETPRRGRGRRIRQVENEPLSSGLEVASRIGYAARGFVYFSIGLMALFAAFGRAPTAEGATGALETWSRWPMGTPLLYLTAFGLFGFAAWRALQSIFDADRQGAEPKAIASRIGQGISGLVYAGLGYSVFRLLDALGDMREAKQSGEASDGVAKVMTLPAGEWLVMLAGLFVIGCGVGNLVQAFKRDFTERLACPPRFKDRAQMLGRIGYAGRGVVFLPAGIFVFLAGQHANAQEAKGTGEALEWLGALPFGDWLLAGVAIGLVAFGLFAFVEARYRSLNVDAVASK
jgi:hypothetical protein